MVSLILQRRETEAQRGKVICPRSHSWEGAESGSELRAVFSALNSPTLSPQQPHARGWPGETAENTDG